MQHENIQSLIHHTIQQSRRVGVGMTMALSAPAFFPSYFGGGPLKFRGGKSTRGVAQPVVPRELSEVEQRAQFFKLAHSEGIRLSKRCRGTTNIKKLRRLVKLERSTPAQRLALTSRQRARATRVRVAGLVAERTVHIDRLTRLNAQLARLVALNVAE